MTGFSDHTILLVVIKVLLVASNLAVIIMTLVPCSLLTHKKKLKPVSVLLQAWKKNYTSSEHKGMHT